MIRFECDYNTGAHPKVMQALMDTNLEACPGYGEDDHCAAAARLIRELCQAPEAAVHFLVGGTQTNLTVIAAALRPHQGVVSTAMGHINDHETGAVEATGHKILPLPSEDGKLTAEQLEQLCRDHETDPCMEHKAQPGMVYLSHPTERGTVYTRAELEAISETAHRHRLLVYLDGARLAYGLAASDPTRPGAAVRRVLHRRHQGRRAVRRGAGDSQPGAPAGLPLSAQAAGRNAGQGPPAGGPV